MLLTFALVVTQYLKKGNEKVFPLAYSSRVKFTREGTRAWQQSHGVAGHVAPTVRKQREMNATARRHVNTFPFLLSSGL